MKNSWAVIVDFGSSKMYLKKHLLSKYKTINMKSLMVQFHIHTHMPQLNLHNKSIQ